MTNFVIDTVKKSRHHWENGGLQGFHVIWQQSDVTLEESHLSPGTIQHCLQETDEKSLKTIQDILISLFFKCKDCKHAFMDLIIMESGPHLYDSLEHVR